MDGSKTDATFLERYVAGEHEQVWAELVALGNAVRQEPLYADALAVARETMRRARQNIEVLIARLSKLGYQFGYEWWGSGDLEILEGLDPPPVFAAPSAEIQRQLDAFEAQVGTLPLAVRAWYEQVGCVNFVGMYPVGIPNISDGFTNSRHIEESRKNQGQIVGYEQAELTPRPCRHDLDPLWVNSLDQVLASRYYPNGDPQRSAVELAPDEFFKYGFPGGGSYEISLPNGSADAKLEGEWHETMFVDYLRICFRWGGFPGLECKQQRPEKELTFLTEGLFPI